MEINSENTYQEDNNQNEEVQINEHKLEQYREKLRLEQNLPMAIVAGVVTALIGAIVWAVITVGTGFQIGYMAIGVGLLVGYGINFLGKGIDQIFGIIGGLFALLGCVLGNMFSLIGFAAIEFNVNYFEIISTIDMAILLDAMVESFSFIDLIFYGIAIYEGYHFAFRKITEEEIAENLG